MKRTSASGQTARSCKAALIRKKMADGGIVIGGHTFFLDPAITESLGYHGFEFVWIDAEHSAFDQACILQHIMAAASAGTASIVRIPWNDPVRVKPILEMGPDGVIFPMVCTRKEAEAAVAACMYPPDGVRGFGPRRANHYGAMTPDDFLHDPAQTFLRIVQIEHIRAVENLRQILMVEGIDFPLVGPNDLAASVGHLGDTKHPEVRRLCEEVIRLCTEEKKPFGVSLGADDREAIRWWIERGAAFVGCGDDISFISTGSRRAIAYARECLKEKQS